MIPGTVARHRWVTDTCRANKGDDGAVREAVESLYAEAMACLRGHPNGSGTRFHFALSVERAGLRSPTAEGPPPPIPKLSDLYGALTVCDRCGKEKCLHTDVQLFCPFISTFRSGPPLEPSEAGIEAFREECMRRGVGTKQDASDCLRAAYAIDGLRAVPSQESTPPQQELERIKAIVLGVCDEPEDDAAYVILGESGTPIVEADTLAGAITQIIGCWNAVELRLDALRGASGRGDPQKEEA